MAQIVYTRTENSKSVRTGTLFQGQKFWISQRVPSRKYFIEQVEANGGKSVELERDADIKIVDHARKEIIPGSYSWTYIDYSVRKGVLEALDDHQVGPPSGTIRSVGSVDQSTKGSRTPFTAEDDRVLYAWVKKCEHEGSKLAGNSIYKQLEQENPRHTFQSWRDRYVKYLKDKPPPAQVPANAPPTPPLDQNLQNTYSEGRSHCPETFDEEEKQALLLAASDIENIHPDKVGVAWRTWAEDYPHHSAREWQDFWENTVRPLYTKQFRARSENTKRKVEKRKVEEMLDAQLHDEKAAERRRLYKPRSPKAASRRLTSYDELGPGQVKSRASLDVSRRLRPFEDDSPYPSIEGSSHTAYSKPGTVSYEPEIPSSSPPLPTATKSNKRRRLERQPSEDREHASSDSGSIEELDFSFEPLFKEPVDGQQGDESAINNNRIPELQGSPSLSEPDRQQKWVGAEIGESHEDVGLDIPSPEGGWALDGEGEGGEGLKVYERDEPESRHNKVEDTQDILNAKTQDLDFSVADPEGGWNAALLPSSPLSLPTLLKEATRQGTASGDEQDMIDDEEDTAILREWITDHVAADVPAEYVEMALKSTNNNPHLAEVVLQSLAQDQGIPKNVAGVWTAEDDEDIYAKDGRKIERLQRKHGAAEFDTRCWFLDEHRKSLLLPLAGTV